LKNKRNYSGTEAQRGRGAKGQRDKGTKKNENIERLAGLVKINDFIY
jgi:hypothetical protein